MNHLTVLLAASIFASMPAPASSHDPEGVDECIEIVLSNADTDLIEFVTYQIPLLEAVVAVLEKGYLENAERYGFFEGRRIRKAIANANSILSQARIDLSEFENHLQWLSGVRRLKRLYGELKLKLMRTRLIQSKDQLIVIQQVLLNHTTKDWNFSLILQETLKKERTSAKADLEPEAPPRDEQRESALNKIREILAENGPAADYIRDFLVSRVLRKAVRENDSTVLALKGGYFSKEQLRELALRTHIILYDADALTLDSAPNKGILIGITADPKRENWPHIVCIQNPHMRLELFLNAQRLIFSPNSATGLGLYLRAALSDQPSALQVFVYDPEAVWTPALPNWLSQLKPPTSPFSFSWWSRPENEPGPSYKSDVLPNRDPVEPRAPQAINLGLPYQSRVTVTPITELRTISGFTRHPMQWKGLQDLETLIAETPDPISLVNNAGIWQSNVKQLEQFRGGLVLYGSSRGNRAFQSRVIDFVTELAIRRAPIVTGGSGGFMLDANWAATNVGAVSIGIPLSRSNLSWERVTYSGEHSLTLPVTDYDLRVGLLSYRRAMAAIAPGGEGTVRELAAELLQLEAQREPRWIVFLCSEYYGGLIPLFDHLSPSIREHIQLINDRKEAVTLIDLIAGTEAGTNIFEVPMGRRP